MTLKDAIDWVDWAFVDADAITYPDTSQLLGKKLDAAQSVAVLQAGAEVLPRWSRSTPRPSTKPSGQSGGDGCEAGVFLAPSGWR